MMFDNAKSGFVGEIFGVLYVNIAVYVGNVRVEAAKYRGREFLHAAHVVRSYAFAEPVVKGGGRVVCHSLVICLNITAELVVIRVYVVSPAEAFFSVKRDVSVVGDIVRPVGDIYSAEAVDAPFVFEGFRGKKRFPQQL